MCKRWIVILSLFLFSCLLISCSNTPNQASSPSPSYVIHISGDPASPTTTAPASSSTPTSTPPTSTTNNPAPVPTSTKAPTGHRCTLQNNCPNPWGFVPGCACGNWHKLTIAPAGFCNYFACIPNFFHEQGVITACMDGMLSHAGGLPGVCSSHGGMMAYLYARNPTPTPTPGKPTPTPTAKPLPDPTPTP